MIDLGNYGVFIRAEGIALQHPDLPDEFNAVRVDILRKGFSGSEVDVKIVENGVYLEYGRRQEFNFEPIQSSNARLNLFVEDSTVAIRVESLFAASPEEFYMRILFNTGAGGALTEYWGGFVRTDFFEEQFQPFPYQTSILATCGLNRLDQIRFNSPGVVSQLDFIRNAIDPITTGSDLSISDDLFSTVFDTGTADDDPLNQALIDFDVYEADNRTVGDVLRSILQSKLLSIRRGPNQWVIWNVGNTNLGTNFRRRLFDADGNFITSFTGFIDRDERQDATKQVKFLNTPQRLASNPITEARARYDFPEIEFLDNINWIQGIDWLSPASSPDISLSGFNFTSQGYNDGTILQDPDSLTMQVRSNNGATRITVPYYDQAFPIVNPDTLSFIEKTAYPDLAIDDNIALRFKIRARPEFTDPPIADPEQAGGGTGSGVQPKPVPFFIRVKQGDLWLQSDGSWDTTPEFIQLVIDADENFQDLEFTTDQLDNNGTLEFRITTGLDTAGDDTERAVNAVLFDRIQVVFVDEDGQEIPFEALRYVARLNNVVNFNPVEIGPFLHGDGPIGGYKGSIRTDDDVYTRLWAFTDELTPAEAPLYQRLVDSIIRRYGQPRDILRGTLLGRFNIINTLLSGTGPGIRLYPNFLKVNMLTNQVEGYWQRVTLDVFDVINLTPEPVLDPIPGPVPVRTSPNITAGAARALAAIRADGMIRKTVQVEANGVDGTLSKRIRALDDEGNLDETIQIKSGGKLTNANEDYRLDENGLELGSAIGAESPRTVSWSEQLGGDTDFRIWGYRLDPVRGGVLEFINNLWIRTISGDFVAIFRNLDISFLKNTIFTENVTVQDDLTVQDNAFVGLDLTVEGSTIQPFIDLPSVVAPVTSLTIGAGTNYTIELTAVGQSGVIRGMSGGINGRKVTLINRGSLRADLEKDDPNANTGEKFYYCKNNLRLNQGQVATFVYMDSIPGNGGEGGWKLISFCSE